MFPHVPAGLAGHPVLGGAFRPMFLGLGAFSVLAMLAWLAALSGVPPGAAAHFGPRWHGHEMLFGFAFGAVGGFLPTAVANWTGRPPLQGGVLAALALAWACGRVAMAVAPASGGVAALAALLFPALLTVLVGREIVLAGNRRNLPIAGIVAALALCDAAWHLGVLGIVAGADRHAVPAALHGLLLLVTVIGGRITPAFTANWLRVRGDGRLPRSVPAVDAVAIGVTLATGILCVVQPAQPLSGVAAVVAASAHAMRLATWRGLATRREPLLFVLHAGYAWLPVGYALLAASTLTGAVPASSSLHAFAAGVIGTMILAVTTRVALGHTGRPLRAAPRTVLAYVVLHAAVLARVVAPVAGAAQALLLNAAALLWTLAWLLFVVVYAPILWRPRVQA